MERAVPEPIVIEMFMECAECGATLRAEWDDPIGPILIHPCYCQIKKAKKEESD